MIVDLGYRLRNGRSDLYSTWAGIGNNPNSLWRIVTQPLYGRSIFYSLEGCMSFWEGELLGICLFRVDITEQQLFSLSPYLRAEGSGLFLFSHFHRTCSRLQNFFFFLGPHLSYMEVPRLGVELELQLLAYTTATATLDLSCTCNLHHSSWHRQILSPPNKARVWTYIVTDAYVGFLTHWATVGPLGLHILLRISGSPCCARVGIFGLSILPRT